LKQNDLQKGVEKLLEDRQTLVKLLEKEEQKQSLDLKNTLKSQILKEIEKGSSKVVIGKKISEIKGELLKSLLYELLDEFKAFPMALVLGMDNEGKAHLAVGLTETHLKMFPETAAGLVKIGSTHIQGGGGGQANYATAGGKNPDGIEKSIEEILFSL